jgi:hypothetical protein
MVRVPDIGWLAKNLISTWLVFDEQREIKSRHRWYALNGEKSNHRQRASAVMLFNPVNSPNERCSIKFPNVIKKTMTLFHW